jgi:hypothetical protein
MLTEDKGANSDSSSQPLHIVCSADRSMEVNYVEDGVDAERAWPSHCPLAGLSF